MTEAVAKAECIRPITTVEERECLARLAARVPDYGMILEIGCLYGGMTAILALSQPNAHVVTIDDFSWHPEDGEPTSVELLLSNMASVGARNVIVHQGDSRVIGREWCLPIDLLWIDGGHSYEFISADLANFGQWAQVIACHDYGNDAWSTIRTAVDEFLNRNSAFYLKEVSGTVAVMKRAHLPPMR